MARVLAEMSISAEYFARSVSDQGEKVLVMHSLRNDGPRGTYMYFPEGTSPLRWLLTWRLGRVWRRAKWRLGY